MHETAFGPILGLAAFAAVVLLVLLVTYAIQVRVRKHRGGAR